MPPVDLEKLRLADPADFKDSLAFALSYTGRKRVHDADRFMARIVADRLVRYLDGAGYVLMNRLCRHEEAADRRTLKPRQGTAGRRIGRLSGASIAA
jgi:hypothetical protein